MSSTDEPGGGLTKLVVAPDASPHRVAHLRPIFSGLGLGGGEVRSCRGTSIRACFLLKVGERQSHGDHSVESRACREVMVHGEPRLDCDEGGGG